MLKKFSVKNFRNFEDWLELDLSAQDYDFNNHAIKNNIVTHSMIYGPNGGGKSNLGLAILDPISHLVDQPNYLSTLDTNYVNGKTKDKKIAEFNFEVLLSGNDVIYRYGKESRTELVYEELLINKELILSIDRRKSNSAVINAKGAEHLKNEIQSPTMSVLKYLINNTVLDKNGQNETIEKLVSFFEGMVFFRSLETNKTTMEYMGRNIGVKRLSQSIIDNNAVDDFEEFLNKSGISCKLCKMLYSNDETVIGIDFGGRKLEFSSAASTGTKSLGVFYYWWLRMRNGDVSFAYLDEFDAFYHHALATQIVEKILDTDCQTIISTHNTGVMTNDLLRPDCYFILDKKISPLYKLTEKELRKAHNLEKIYKGISS